MTPLKSFFNYIQQACLVINLRDSIIQCIRSRPLITRAKMICLLKGLCVDAQMKFPFSRSLSFSLQSWQSHILERRMEDEVTFHREVKSITINHHNLLSLRILHGVHSFTQKCTATLILVFHEFLNAIPLQ
jgi:hypothetical protein